LLQEKRGKKEWNEEKEKPDAAVENDRCWGVESSEINKKTNTIKNSRTLKALLMKTVQENSFACLRTRGTMK